MEVATETSPVGFVGSVGFWNVLEFVAQRQKQGWVLGDMVRATGKSKVYVRRCLWISTWPADLQKRARERPNVFNTRVMLGGLATSMKRFEQGNWEGLRKEMARFEKGAVAVRKPRTKNKVVHKEILGVSLASSTEAQDRLRQKLMTLVEVTQREIKIRYFGEEDLESVLETLLETGS